MPLALEPLTRKDFTCDQEVRWCPGCGDYAVLAAFQGFMPELGIRKENTVIVSGIGCSSAGSRTTSTPTACTRSTAGPRRSPPASRRPRPDAAVFVITGDGDALSIGGNHLIHALRRNVNLTILLFNNRIYGLTKGQYSPTSEIGKVTKSTPMGSLDNPFNPVSLALGAEATFVARTIDSDRKHLTSVLRAAAAHRGTSFVEIYQNCPIFNDDAFAAVKDRDERGRRDHPADPRRADPLRRRRPARRRPRPADRGVRAWSRSLTVGEDALVVHDAHVADPSYAFGLSRLTDSGVLHRAPIGIFRDVDAPAYDDLAREQVALATSGRSNDEAALQALINGGDTWQVDDAEG